MGEVKDLVLTKEMKEKLSGLLAFQVDAIYKYVPALYREKKNGTYIIPKEFWPVFSIRSLNGVELDELEDTVGFTVLKADDPNYREFHGRSGTRRLEVLRKGLKGWKNFRDDTGKIVAYEEGDAGIAKLPLAIRQDLQEAIMERMTLTEEELRSLES